MRIGVIAALAVLITGAERVPAPAPVPVVVELFTSEGCSSCPPADVVLSELATGQPVEGVQVVALGMHVTYWDQLGWKDPASLDLATRRQQDYSRVFGPDRVYTPQAVVDGQAELIGSAGAGVRQALAKAGRLPHASLAVSTSLDGDAVVAEVSVADIPADASEPLEGWVVVTEDGLTSTVKRGENGGRTLRHDAVVRAMVPAAEKRGQPPFPGQELTGKRGQPPFPGNQALTARVQLKPDWRRDRLHVVALIQGTRSQRIWGAATSTLK